MAGYVHFTEEQKELARNKSIVDFLRSQGQKVERSGSEHVWMDGTAKVTLRGNLWYHVYEEQGHDIIAFLERYYNLTYPEAVEMLLNGEGGTIEYSSPIERKPKELFSLPPKNSSMRRVYGYLLNERKLDKSVVDTFVKAGMIYEDAKYHNAVFVGYDKDGIPRHAHKRGTTQGSTYRGNVVSCMPEYCFHWHGTSSELFVFEAPIDMLSYITLNKEGWQKHSYTSSCGLSRRAMMQMLKDNPCIQKVWICLDNDHWGEKGAEKFQKELEEYRIRYERKRSILKDWNCDVVHPEETEEVSCEQQGIQLS